MRRRDAVRLLGATTGPDATCSTASHAGPFPAASDRVARHRAGTQPALVVRLRGEVAELGPQAPGVLEEEPAVGRDRDVVAEQVLEDGTLRLLGVRALRDLRQLVRVAEEDEVARARPGRERVGERELTGLVDEEHVDRTLAA